MKWMNFRRTGDSKMSNKWLIGTGLCLISGVLFGHIMTKENFVIVLVAQILMGVGSSLVAMKEKEN